MKKLYRKLFELFAWLGLYRLAAFFYLRSAHVARVGDAVIFSNVEGDWGKRLEGYVPTEEEMAEARELFGDD